MHCCSFALLFIASLLFFLQRRVAGRPPIIQQKLKKHLVSWCKLITRSPSFLPEAEWTFSEIAAQVPFRFNNMDLLRRVITALPHLFTVIDTSVGRRYTYRITIMPWVKREVVDVEEQEEEEETKIKAEEQ